MKKFSRRKEDFKCRHCHKKVIGNGYTNHCPSCLYSVHVDQNPGDRMAECGGLMKPVKIVQKHREIKIIHRCEKCKTEKINRLSPGDNQEMLLKIIASI